MKIVENIGLILVVLLLNISCSSGQKETISPLEIKLDSLMAKMTIQDKIEQLYYLTDGNERLNIPQFKGSDGPHGVGNNAPDFSSFPVTIAMASSWDPELIMRVGRAISMEQAARGKDRIAGPTLDMLIEPRIGRAPETIGEDPFLGSRISEAFVLGQNSTPVFGTIKHYNLNTYEINRRTNNYLSDERSLIEFWGYHWKRTIQHGGAMSLMCAYNWINGDKCAENKFLIKDLVRDHWGYDYYTMCDWGGFSDTKKALNAELDFCEGNDLYIKELPDGVKNGVFDTSLVNRAARNVLRTKLVSGMLDGKPFVSKDIIDSEEHRQLVYESGLKSLVLLKNQEHILPLDVNKLNSIAVIGPNADVLPLDGHSSSNVLPPYRIPVLDAMQKVLGPNRVKFSKGCNINDNSKDGFSDAIELAFKSEYVLFVAGLDSTIEGEGFFINKEADEKGGGVVNRPDRPTGSVLLPGMQNELIKQIAKVNPNIILVVLSGGTCSVTPVVKDVKGLLYAFYPGQEGGRAIVDVLLGKYNPSGKLPATVPKSDEQIIPINPDFRNLVTKGFGYRWFDSQNIEPEFSFGFGLSYTTFKYSNIQVSKENAKVGDFINVSFDLSNIGDIAGEEVAQLYLSTKKITPNIKMPIKQLRGFEKVYLKPGETKKMTMTLTPEELYIYNESTKSYQVPEGEFVVRVGGSSDILPLQAKFKLDKSEEKTDLLVKNIRTIPAYPKEGDEVVFMVSLINNGTAPTKIGEKYTLHFYVNEEKVATYCSKSLEIPVGGMELACAQNEVPLKWKAAKGKFQIKAVIDIAESSDLNSDNNICEGVLQIPDGKVIPVEVLNVID